MGRLSVPQKKPQSQKIAALSNRKVQHRKFFCRNRQKIAEKIAEKINLVGARNKKSQRLPAFKIAALKFFGPAKMGRKKREKLQRKKEKGYGYRS